MTRHLLPPTLFRKVLHHFPPAYLLTARDLMCCVTRVSYTGSLGGKSFGERVEKLDWRLSDDFGPTVLLESRKHVTDEMDMQMLHVYPASIPLLTIGWA